MSYASKVAIMVKRVKEGRPISDVGMWCLRLYVGFFILICVALFGQIFGIFQTSSFDATMWSILSGMIGGIGGYLFGNNASLHRI
jgi:hypothetical protein